MMGTSRRAEALAFLGIARRAGAVVKGTDATRRALRDREIRLVLVADDSAEGQRGKVIPLARAQGVPVERLGDKEALGTAVGGGLLSVVGVTDGRMAQELRVKMGRD